MGNTLTGGGRTNTWDSQNRLVKCITGTGASQKTSTFTYGSDGLRRTMNVQTGDVASTAQYSETRYILDSTNVVQEQTRQKSGSGGSWTAWASVNYLMGPSGPLARLTANAVDARWYVYDGLGSVLAEVDVNGAIQGTRKYDVYGATRSYTGTPVGRQAFVGQLGHATDDETGLTYMRARYYDNVTGRFISEDTKGDGNNWFLYCGNDPINRVDFNGNDSKNWDPWQRLCYALAQGGGWIGGIAWLMALASACCAKYTEAMMLAAMACALYIIALRGAGSLGGSAGELLSWFGEIGGLVGGGGVLAFFLWFKGAKELVETSKAARGFAYAAVAGELAHGIELWAAVLSID